MQDQISEHNEKEHDLDNEFNNAQAVETIYTDEDIDLLDFSPPPAANDAYYGDIDHVVANEHQSEVYCLDTIRLGKLKRRQERRTSKDNLSDRRTHARLDASGGIQQDRRSVNRLANLTAIREAGGQD